MARPKSGRLVLCVLPRRCGTKPCACLYVVVRGSALNQSDEEGIAGGTGPDYFKFSQGVRLSFMEGKIF